VLVIQHHESLLLKFKAALSMRMHVLDCESSLSGTAWTLSYLEVETDMLVCMGS